MDKINLIEADQLILPLLSYIKGLDHKAILRDDIKKDIISIWNDKEFIDRKKK